MSLSISGIGAVQPIYPSTAAAVPYAQDPNTTSSVAGTTAGNEGGAASVVYEPGPTDAGEQYTYSNRAQPAIVPPPATDDQQTVLNGDEAVVAATGGAVAPPPQVPETPHAAEVKQLLNNVWAPVKPVAVDPTATAGNGAAPVQADQAEASAQASYSAVASAMIAGASLSDLHKFG